MLSELNDDDHDDHDKTNIA